MSETFAEEVEREIIEGRAANKSPAVIATLITIRIIMLAAVFACVTGGLWSNGIVHAELFGIAAVICLMWLRGKKSS